MAGVNSARVKPAFGGMNSEASPEYVPDNQAAVLENLLPRPGKVVLRGPISGDIDLGVANYSYMVGASVLGSEILLKVGTVLKNVSSAVVSGGAGAVIPGPRGCSLGSYSYTVPDIAPAVRLTKWSGAGAAVDVANGPQLVADVATHLSRLFTVRRTAGGVNELNWSDVGGPVADTAAEWQDDVSGLVNVIVVGDATDLARGLGHVGKQLAILKDRSIWMLTGLTPATFAVNRATSQWGCVSRESIVDHDDGCFFLSERGFAYFDGSSVVDVSEDVKTELLAAIRDAPFPFDNLARVGPPGTVWPATLRPFARAAAIGRDCIMLTIGRESLDTAVPSTVYFSALYDSRQKSWSKFSSDAFTVGAPIYFVPTPAASYYAGATLGYDASGNLMYLDDIAAPESGSPVAAGADTVDGTTALIPATSYSRIIQLSSPGKTSQLKRLLFDYTFVVLSDDAGPIDCWAVSLVDGQGNVLLAPTPVQATILATSYTDAQRRAALVRKRFQVEFFGEAAEVQLRVTMPTLDTAAANVSGVIAAEIHDATIEFIPGRDRPTS